MQLMRPIPPSTDEDALLAAVAAAPLDDAPRLVYADWLQDRGDEARADYLRAVVALTHPPEQPAAVEKCVALADTLDADWRRAVGGRFEVVLEGSAAMQLVAFLLRMVVGLAFQEHIGPWRSGEPIRLRASLTREDAEAFVGTYRDPILRQMKPYDPSVRMFVRPMGEEVPLTLFAPAPDE
jgi:uncharacterized protein (TIGR02996 family)